MNVAFQSCRYAWTPIAQTGDRFSDFQPYVAAVNNRGVVAFQAALQSGGSGVFTGDGRSLITCIEASVPFSEVHSHPDINDAEQVCFYARFKARGGGSGVFRVHDQRITTISLTTGPLGPTMNEDGIVSFRAEFADGRAGMYIGGGDEAAIVPIAETFGSLSGFQGLPVINNHRVVSFRADFKSGNQSICTSDGTTTSTIASTSKRFGSLGHFPTMNDHGVVAFVGTSSTGLAGVFTASHDTITALIDSTSAFESFRGVLMNNAGRIVLLATPRGGTLGAFAGPDPQLDRLIAMGAPLFGSTIVDWALNPVSFNDFGQIAIRVRLADDRQFILRGDPT